MNHNTTSYQLLLSPNSFSLPDSFIDSEGKRWVKMLFDVMSDNGRHFVRQVRVTLGLHFDLASGRYVLDKSLVKLLVDEIIRQNPSLASVRHATFIPTTKRLING